MESTAVMIDRSSRNIPAKEVPTATIMATEIPSEFDFGGHTFMTFALGRRWGDAQSANKIYKIS